MEPSGNTKFPSPVDNIHVVQYLNMHQMNSEAVVQLFALSRATFMESVSKNLVRNFHTSSLPDAILLDSGSAPRVPGAPTGPAAALLLLFSSLPFITKQVKSSQYHLMKCR